MVKASLILYFLCAWPIYGSDKKGFKANRFLNQNQNLSEQVQTLKNDLETNRENINFLIETSLKIYMKNKFDHNNHIVNIFLKEQVQKMNFDQGQLIALENLKSENLKKAIKSIPIEEEVLERMGISPLEYWETISKIKTFIRKIARDNKLKKMNCSQLNVRNQICLKGKFKENKLKVKNKRIVLKKGYNLTEIDPQLEAYGYLYPPKSGSLEDQGEPQELRMSFFKNGVIVNVGVLK